MHLPRVLLPAPFSPLRAGTSPATKATETASSAWVSPKRLERCSTRRRVVWSSAIRRGLPQRHGGTEKREERFHAEAQRPQRRGEEERGRRREKRGGRGEERREGAT